VPMNLSFGQIMDALPSLSKVQLRSIAQFAQQLCEEGKAVPRQRVRGPRNVKGSKSQKHDEGQHKEPAKKLVSVHAEMPEYKAFKDADKALKALLKAEKKDLKSLEKDLLSRATGSDAHLTVKKFHDSREAYFRAKTALPSSTNAPTSSTSSPPSSATPFKTEEKGQETK
jgi:hypothetical protein